MRSAAVCGVTVIWVLMLSAGSPAPQQQRLVFSPSRRSSRDDPARPASGRLIFSPPRLIFSPSGSRAVPAPPPPSSPPPHDDGMSRLQTYLRRVRLSQEAGRSWQRERAAAVRQAASGVRGRGAGAAAASPASPRPRVGPRSPEAVAANPDAAIVPRGGSARTTVPRGGSTRTTVPRGGSARTTVPRSGSARSSLTTVDVSADSFTIRTPADETDRLHSDTGKLGSNAEILDSAARAGLRSPGLALTDQEPAAVKSELGADMPTVWDEPVDVSGLAGTDGGPEEAEDTVYGGAVDREELIYRGPVRGEDLQAAGSATDDGQTSAPIDTSPLLLDELETSEASEASEARQFSEPAGQDPEYLADLQRLGRDFVYLPGLNALDSESVDWGETASVSVDRGGTKIASLPLDQDGANVVYVYIVRGDGGALDLYAANGESERSGRAAGTSADVVSQDGAGARSELPTAVVEVADSESGAPADRDAKDNGYKDLSGIEIGAADLDGAADSSASLVTLAVRPVGSDKDEGYLSPNTVARGSVSPGTSNRGLKDPEKVNRNSKDSITSVYFDPANEVLANSEAISNASFHLEKANAASAHTQQDDANSSSPDRVGEERGIFFFPGNVIHSFGIEPSPEGQPVVVSQPRPGVPSLLSSTNQSTPIASLLSPAGLPLTQTPGAGVLPLTQSHGQNPPAIDRVDSADPQLTSVGTLSNTVTDTGTPPAVLQTGAGPSRPVIFSENSVSTGDRIKLSTQPASKPTKTKIVFPGSSQKPVKTGGPFKFPPSASKAGTSPGVSPSASPFSPPSRPFLFSPSRPRPAAVAAERVDAPVTSATPAVTPVTSVTPGGQCQPEPDCAQLSRRRRGCSVHSACPQPQRCCFSQCLGVSVCQEGTYRDRLAGLSALAKVVVP